MTTLIKNKNKHNKNILLSKIKNKIAIAGILTLGCFNAMALDTVLSLHKGDESKTVGLSITLADNFSKNSNFYWSLGYSTLNDVKVEWNNDDLFFKNDTVEALLSYRQKLTGFNNQNSFLKNITIEYQIGASVGLTENKFFWTDLNEEKYFSETADINPIIAISTHYNFSKKSAIILGLKHQPNFSEFGNISTLFLGINYKFGRAAGY